MKRSTLALAVLAALGGAQWQRARAAVLITEVLYNEVGSDTAGEWVELTNTGPSIVDLSGYKIGDEETKGGDNESGGMWQFPSGSSLGAGQTIVVANSAARFSAVYGFNPQYELIDTTAGVGKMQPYLAWLDPAEVNAMSNSNDQSVLLGPDDSVADIVGWGNTVAFDPGLPDAELDGQSYERINLVDTDTAADWRLGTPSSPGVAPVPEPAALSLVGLGAAGLLTRRRRTR